MKVKGRVYDKFNPKRLLLLIGLAIFIIVKIISFIEEYSNSVKDKYLELAFTPETTVGPIVEGTIVVQEIPCHGDDLGVDIEFATYGRINSGLVRVIITGKNTGIVYVDETRPANYFEDNVYASFLYKSEVSPEDSMMVVNISSTSKENGLTVWASKSDELPKHNMMIDDMVQSGDLIMRIIRPGNRGKFAVLFFCIQLVIVTFCYLAIIRMKINTGRAFFLLTFGLGLLYMLAMTPMAIPDEKTHYQSAYQLSNAFLFQWNEMDYGDANHFDYSGLREHVNVGSAYDRFFRELFSPKGSYEKVEIPYPHSISYPVMLIPQALGIFIGRLLGANFLITFYLARFCNLLFYSFCIYYAVKKAPRFKLMFGTLGIMPMALHQAASCSYDTFINGMMFVLLALILNGIDQDEQITIGEIIHIVVVSALLCPAKAVYTPVLLCLCLIPKNRFFNQKHRWFFIVGTLVLCCCLILLFQMMILSDLVTSEPKLNWEGGKNFTVSYILQHPRGTIDIFSRTFQRDWKDWMQQGVGRILAGLTIMMDELPIYTYIGLLIISAFSYEGENRSFSLRQKLTFITSAMCTVFAVMLTMFLGWTSDTRTVILGIQGRYFIPIFPLLLMCLNNRMVKNNHPIEKYVSAVSVLINYDFLTHVLFITMSS